METVGYRYSMNLFKKRLENILRKGFTYLNIDEDTIEEILRGKYKNLYVINVGDSTIHIRVYFKDDKGEPKTKTIRSIKNNNEKDKEKIINYINKLKYIFSIYRERFFPD